MKLKCISKIGSISEGTIKQYKEPIRKFYQWLWKEGKHKPSASNIILYIQTQNPTLHDLKGIARIKKTQKIFLKEEQKNLIKETKFFYKKDKYDNPIKVGIFLLFKSLQVIQFIIIWKYWHFDFTYCIIQALVFQNWNKLHFK
ncbi:unnamed protein product [Paramecium sonneborni]|uniref:Uncharacterized protein n=1 Tax=Paramecium sonneborni TaxID=65129 RepID=A0A8S1NME3_9CILI|nr:unnamed protein product [Paramecium sonneborni]